MQLYINVRIILADLRHFLIAIRYGFTIKVADEA